MTVPSLITLAKESWLISPVVTFEPATLPTFDTLKISKISAEPVMLSSTLEKANLTFCF